MTKCQTKEHIHTYIYKYIFLTYNILIKGMMIQEVAAKVKCWREDKKDNLLSFLMLIEK